MPKIFSMPKIKVSKDANHKSKHDLSHDVSTSMEFGFCAPQFSKLMIPDSTLDIDVAASIRLMPMPLPTFGRVSMKYYHQFVPMEDLWRPTNAFFSQQYYNTTSVTDSPFSGYIPSKVPSMSMVDSDSAIDDINVSNPQGAPSILSLLFGGDNCYWTVRAIESGSIGQDRDKNFGLQTNLKYSTSAVSESSISTAAVNKAMLLGYKIDNQTKAGNHGFSIGLSPVNRDPQAEATSNPVNMNLSNCDYFFVLPGVRTSNGDDTLVQSTTNSKQPYIVLIKLTNSGRRVRKILQGLGYQTDHSLGTTPLNILPLFAYYKAWYDLMVPAREQDWYSTGAYKLLDSHAEYGDWYSNDTSKGITDNSLTNAQYLWMRFFQQELPSCFATGEPNYVSMQLDTPSLEKLSDQRFTFPDESISDMNKDFSIQVMNSGTNACFDTNNGLTGTALKFLSKMTKYIDKNTIIGNRIAEFMKVHFGAEVDDDSSNYIGKQEVSAQIGDVYATAETEDKDLGQYAGQGYGSTDEVPHFKFHAKLHGYYITYASIEPVSNYVQSIEGENFQTTPYEFAQPAFDSLGYEISRRAEVLCNQDMGYGAQGTKQPYNTSNLIPTNLSSAEGFGYVPRYASSKTMKSKLLGDLSLRSTRDSYLGYTMDNWISTNVFNRLSSETGKYTDSIANILPSYLRPGVQWRFLSLYPFLNNYNRIFYNQGHEIVQGDPQVGNDWMYDVLDDNFIVHSAWNITYTAPLLSLSESFNTDGDSNETLSLTHS